MPHRTRSPGGGVGARPLGREFPFTAADFRYLASLLHSHTGIRLSDQKRNMVYARLARRIRRLSMGSFKAYIQFLESREGEEELDHLLNALTTNLTRFFREPGHFDHLKSTCLPEAFSRIQKGIQSRVRIWSAGCSTGEEPYSIASVLHSSLKKQPPELDAKILATDLDSNVLHEAALGQYSVESFKNVDPHVRDTIARPVEDTDLEEWSVRDELMAYVTFKHLNLIETWPMKGPFDAIFCRNVMIYFDETTTKALLKRFIEMLRPGGYLYIGHSENIMGMSDRLVRTDGTTYQRIS